MVNAVVVPPELSKFTGLPDALLERLVSPDLPSSLAERAANCPATNTSGGVFAGPASPSSKALQKRNSFVTRCVLG